MGFTEAEIGFVVAALFAAIAVATINERDQAVITASQLERIKTELQETKDRLRLATQELEELRKKVSTKVPQCWEKGQSREAVADVNVIGENQFEVGGAILTIDGITEMLADKVALSSRLGCRFVLRARPKPGVDAIAQSAAVWRLRRFFDVDDRPR